MNWKEWEKEKRGMERIGFVDSAYPSVTPTPLISYHAPKPSSFPFSSSRLLNIAPFLHHSHSLHFITSSPAPPQHAQSPWLPRSASRRPADGGCGCFRPLQTQPRTPDTLQSTPSPQQPLGGSWLEELGHWIHCTGHPLGVPLPKQGPGIAAGG